MKFENGFYDMPAGKLATIVTALEMFAKPDAQPIVENNNWSLSLIEKPDADEYRELYRKIGQDWLWFSRAVMPKEELQSIISDPNVEIRFLEVDGIAEGLLELDYRIEGECELAFLGLTANLQGKGAGKWLMNEAINLAWTRSIDRFWIHTCTLDHPRALPFYIKSGFVPYQRQLEIADDPRVSGVFPNNVAPHFPILD